MKVKLSYISSLILIILVLFGAYYVYAGITGMTLNSPTSGTNTSNNDVSFQCTATTNGENVSNISIGLNSTGNSTDQIFINVTNDTGTNAFNISNITNFIVNNIPDGRFVWNCLGANDSAIMIIAGATFITAAPNANTTSGANFSRLSNSTITVDTAGPNNVTLIFPNDNSSNRSFKNLTSSDFTNGTVTVRWTAHDALMTVALCNVTVNDVIRAIDVSGYSGGNGSQGGGDAANYTASVSGFNPSLTNNSWSVSCTDFLGNGPNISRVSWAIPIVDTVVPIIDGIDQRLRFKGTVNGQKNVEGTKFDFGTPVNIRGCNGTDNVDYFNTNATLRIKLPGASDFSGDLKNDTGGIDNFEFTDTKALGLYDVNCTIRDSSGNQNSTAKTFEIVRASIRKNSFATSDGFRQPISTGSRRDFGELSTDGLKTRISEGGVFLFQIDGEDHEVLVEEIKGDTIIVVVQSEPITATIKIGESKSFDVNNDGTNDIEINLETITSSNRADIDFNRVSTPAPKPPTTEPTPSPRPSTPIITREEVGSLLKILIVVFVVLLIVYFFIRVKKRPSSKLQFNRRDLGAYRDTTLQLYYK